MSLGPGDWSVADRTQPPPRNLRFPLVMDLCRVLPDIEEMLQIEADDTELPEHFVRRLAESPTPEEALTFTAYALNSHMAVWWGHDCLARISSWLPPEDADILELISDWVHRPVDPIRHRLAELAKGAAATTPAVWLAFGAAWSGGPIEPGDTTRVPAFRTPQAVNAAVLSGLARGHPRARRETLNQFVDLAIEFTRA